jgi:hypothetical protein
MNETELNDAFLRYETALLYQARQIAEHPRDLARLNHTKPELDDARTALVSLLGGHTHPVSPTPVAYDSRIVKTHPDTLPMVTHYNPPRPPPVPPPVPPQVRVCLHEYVKTSADEYQCIYCAHTKPVKP